MKIIPDWHGHSECKTLFILPNILVIRLAYLAINRHYNLCWVFSNLQTQSKSHIFAKSVTADSLLKLLLACYNWTTECRQCDSSNNAVSECCSVCLSAMSAQRPTAKELLKHKFITRYTKKTAYLTELIDRYRRWKSEGHGEESSSDDSDM